MPHKHHKYRLTTISCFAGIFTQAIITNLTAILFIPLMNLYGFSFVHLGILVGINFTAQVFADIIFSGLIDKIGFRKISLCTCLIAFAGLLLFALTPMLFFGSEFVGFVVATIVFAFSSGLLEVVLSPIIDAIPNDDKGPAMSLMHSFYAWGQVATIVITTLFLFFVGYEHWQTIVFLWALIPFITFFMFLKSVMPPNSGAETRLGAKDLLTQPFYLCALAAILFGGATEVCMNQWASTFMEGALHVPKIVGDLFGMCGFAIMLGLGRMVYGFFGAKLNIRKILLVGSGLSVIGYLVVALSPFNAVNIIACAVTGFFCSVLWPGVLVVTSEKFPMSGAWMFAILAAAGDIGAATGPYLTGLVTDMVQSWPVTGWMMQTYNTTAAGAALRLGILVSLVLPLLTFLCHIVISRLAEGEKQI